MRLEIKSNTGGHATAGTTACPGTQQSVYPYTPYQAPYQCPFLNPCWNCRWKYEAWWGVVPPCAGCPWNPVPYITRTTPYYEVTC